MRAGDRFLGLNNFDRVGSAGAKAFARLRERLLREVYIAPRDVHELLRGLDVEERRADVRVNLSLQVGRLIASLLQPRTCFEPVALPAAALKNRNRQRAANAEDAMRNRCRIVAREAIVRAEIERR